ncbi:MAG: hypothetical protein AVDCRST_MAG68-4219, partial [uncultured Gemmatimonadetes bacterium]
ARTHLAGAPGTGTRARMGSDAGDGGGPARDVQGRRLLRDAGVGRRRAHRHRDDGPHGRHRGRPLHLAHRDRAPGPDRRRARPAGL